jgi:hypothetical protein
LVIFLGAVLFDTVCVEPCQSGAYALWNRIGKHRKLY